MSEPTVTIGDIVLPAGTIVGSAGSVHADGYDPDLSPDLSAWEGVQVTFTPTAPLVILTTPDGPVMLEPRQETGRFFGGRLLYDLAPPEGEERQLLRLWASEGQDMVPPVWGWRMSLSDDSLPNKLPPEIKKVSPPAFSLPPGATINVASIIGGSLPPVPPVDPEALAAAVLTVLARADDVDAAVVTAEAAATAAEAAADRAEAVPAASTIVAAGRPDVPATTPYTATQLNTLAIGTEYRSTDGPQGAWKWRKTGPTNWVVTDGDTGGRAIPAMSPWAGAFHIRRTNNDVVLSNWTATAGASGVASGTNVLASMPAGFEFDLVSSRGCVDATRNGNDASTSRVIQSGVMLGPALPAGNLLRFSHRYSTSSPWPTTLPGTAA